MEPIHVVLSLGRIHFGSECCTKGGNAVKYFFYGHVNTGCLWPSSLLCPHWSCCLRPGGLEWNLHTHGRDFIYLSLSFTPLLSSSRSTCLLHTGLEKLNQVVGIHCSSWMVFSTIYSSGLIVLFGFYFVTILRWLRCYPPAGSPTLKLFLSKS